MWKVILALLASAISSSTQAEPIGSAWRGFGRATTEYAIQNDSAGSDVFYTACRYDQTRRLLSVGGSNPKPQFQGS